MNIMYQHMMWSVFVLAKQKAPAAKEIKTLCAQRDRFISQLDEYISAALSPEIALQVTTLTLVDVWLIISAGIPVDTGHVAAVLESLSKLRDTLLAVL